MSTDVDIDFADREQILKLLDYTPAMIKDGTKEKKHNTKKVGGWTLGFGF